MAPIFYDRADSINFYQVGFLSLLQDLLEHVVAGQVLAADAAGPVHSSFENKSRHLLCG
jgi:hypothetical protein